MHAKRANRFSRYGVLLLLAYTFCAKAADNPKFASIIIDDLGNNLEHGREVIELPAAVTLSILPRTTFAAEVAALAHENHKEVMLHLPLQSVENHKHTPGTLGLHMTHEEFRQQLKLDLASVPFVSGINNHMGSLLTQHPGFMSWLMSEMSRLDSIYFIDSLTSNKSVAARIADEYHVPNLVRDVFLDPDFEPDTLRKQFDRFIEIASTKGTAVALAHPHPATLEFLRNHLDELKQHGIELVPVSKLLQQQKGETNVTCTGTTCSGL